MAGAAAWQDNGGSVRPKVLHLSGDFPDPFEPFKTPVISKLLELTRDQFDHRVISINRVSPGSLGTLRALIAPAPFRTERQLFEHGMALRYTAPGKGIWHQTLLERLGEQIVAEVEAMDHQPDLLVGHKLTIEGIAIARAAELLDLPYALSVQGNTDTKILASRPDLKPLFARIFHGAKAVFPFAPWTQRDVEAALGTRAEGKFLLPCPTDLDQLQPPRPTGDGLITVFHLKNYENKSLSGIVKAYRELARHGTTPPPLKVMGGGSKEELTACRALTRDFPQITFVGPMDRAALAQRMNCASALILPSLRESFGLVFLEALFAGTPIIYPQDTAVDGYFDRAAFALRVNARKPASLADAIHHACNHEEQLKQALAKWQDSPQATRFTRKSIATQFAAGLNQALDQGTRRK